MPSALGFGCCVGRVGLWVAFILRRLRWPQLNVFILEV